MGAAVTAAAGSAVAGTAAAGLAAAGTEAAAREVAAAAAKARVRLGAAAATAPGGERVPEHCPISVLQAHGGGAIPRLALWTIDRFVRFSSEPLDDSWNYPAT